MRTFIYPLILMGFCGLLFAQEQEEILASSCLLYPPNLLITIEWFPPTISIKMDQKNWTTDIFLKEKDNSGKFPSSVNTCIRLAAQGNHIEISGYKNPICGSMTPFHTANWTVNNDEMIHLLIQGVYSSHLSLRLIGYDTQVASMPIYVDGFFKVKSSSKIEIDCHKGCNFWFGRNTDIKLTKPIVLYGIESPLNLTMNLTMSHDGIKESHSIALPSPLKDHTLYQVEVKETPNELMITINSKGKRYQVVEEKMSSLEEAILNVRSGLFLYNDPKCTFKDQENEGNKDDDSVDGDEDGVDGDEDGIATTTITTTADDGDDEEKPKQNHNFDIDMTVKMIMNGTLTIV